MSQQNNVPNDGLFYCCYCLCGCVYLALIICCFASIGIAELIMASKHGSEIVCKSSIISLHTWLIVDGIITIIGGTIIGLLYAGTENEADYAEAAHKANKPFVVFSLIWTIIGSIVYWHDCPHVTPHSINQLMMAVLIISYIGLYLYIDSDSKYEQRKTGEIKIYATVSTPMAVVVNDDNV
jgi:hypothetical protein